MNINLKIKKSIYTKLSKNLIMILILVSVVVSLYFLSKYNYLIFHTFVELFSIIVAVGVFVLAWNFRSFFKNGYFIFIGIAYLFVASIDLVHTMAYKGMGIFVGYSANLPTQLWISARYLESLSLIIALIFISKKLKYGYVLFGYTIGISILFLSIFYWNIFPDCFIEGVGLTPFKIYSEYIISALLTATFVLLHVFRKNFDREVLRLLLGSVLVTIFSELSFTLFNDIYGLWNMLGHLFKIVSFYLIYKAVIETGLKKPFSILLRDLKKSEEGFFE